MDEQTASIRQRVRDRLEAEGIPVGSDDPILNALGAPELPTPVDPDYAAYKAGTLSPLRGEDTHTWIDEHYANHDGEWGDCMAGFCGVIVRLVQAWETAKAQHPPPATPDPAP